MLDVLITPFIEPERFRFHHHGRQGSRVFERSASAPASASVMKVIVSAHEGDTWHVLNDEEIGDVYWFLGYSDKTISFNDSSYGIESTYRPWVMAQCHEYNVGFSHDRVGFSSHISGLIYHDISHISDSSPSCFCCRRL